MQPMAVFIFVWRSVLWVVDAIRPVVTDWSGVNICLVGVIVIMYGKQLIRNI